MKKSKQPEKARDDNDRRRKLQFKKKKLKSMEPKVNLKHVKSIKELDEYDEYDL